MQVRRILGAVSWCLAGSTAWSTQGSWTARKCQPCPRTPVSYVPGLNSFGPRNDVPPRTVANSDKEISKPNQTTNTESSNPAMTQIANARTWQPGITSAHQPQNLAPNGTVHAKFPSHDFPLASSRRRRKQPVTRKHGNNHTRQHRGYRSRHKEAPRRPMQFHQITRDNRTDNRSGATDTQTPAHPRSTQRGGINSCRKRIVRRLRDDNSKPAHRDKRHHQRERDVRHLTDPGDRQRRNQIAGRQDTEESPTVNKRPHRDRSYYPAYLKRGADKRNARHAVSGIGGNGRQPVRQEEQVQQVHEVHGPQQQRHTCAAGRK